MCRLYMYVIAIVFSWVCDKSCLRYMYEVSKVAPTMLAGFVLSHFHCVFRHSWKTILLLFGCRHVRLVTHQVVQSDSSYHLVVEWC